VLGRILSRLVEFLMDGKVICREEEGEGRALPGWRCVMAKPTKVWCKQLDEWVYLNFENIASSTNNLHNN